MITVLYIILTGLLVRADGWGTDDPKWQRLAKFLNVWSCGILFGVLTGLSFLSVYPALAATFAFIVWRLPGFNGWENFWSMLIRGAWPSFLGFTLLSFVTYGHPFGGWLLVPFSLVYAAIYSGGYKFLPEVVLGLNRHVWIEHASGWVFGLSVFILLSL